MDFSHLLHSAYPKIKELNNYGFTETSDSVFSLKKNLSQKDLYAKFTLNIKDNIFEIHVFDKLTGDRYALFDIPNSQGAFVGALREEISIYIEEIRSKCFKCEDLNTKYISWLEEKFNCKPDFPWPDTPEACVFRCPNNKWFALVMKIKYRQLGFTSDEEVFIVNLKAPKEQIAASENNGNGTSNSPLIDKKSVFPAYHMNKKHWITLLLTSVTNFEKLCFLTEQSYRLVNGKTKKMPMITK